MSRADGRSSALSLGRLWRATRYSMQGLRAAFHHEAAFRQELALAAVLIPTALWLGSTATQRALLISTCLLVLLTELLNSAVEAAVDRIGMDANDLSGRAKDLGSAAVFVSLMLTLVVWGLIAYERFLA